jgi:hypothetical protein
MTKYQRIGMIRLEQIYKGQFEHLKKNGVINNFDKLSRLATNAQLCSEALSAYEKAKGKNI